MGPEAAKNYLRAQEDAVALLVESFLHNPKDFWNQTRLYVWPSSGLLGTVADSLIQ